MSELSKEERAMALGQIIQSTTGACPVERCPGQNTFGIHLAIRALKDAAALTSIIKKLPKWRIEAIEGNDFAPMFCLHYRGKDESPDVLPLLEALLAFKERTAEKIFVQPSPDLVM